MYRGASCLVPNTKDLWFSIVCVLELKTVTDMLTWSGHMGHCVYNMGVTLLIGEITQFPRKEGFRKLGLIKRWLKTDVGIV